jgi:hypothetical protein
MLGRSPHIVDSFHRSDPPNKCFGADTFKATRGSNMALGGKGGFTS